MRTALVLCPKRRKSDSWWPPGHLGRRRQGCLSLRRCGGGELASDFIRADAVDRYIVGILPVIRGKGRRLFQEGIPPVELHLDRCTVSDGIPILEYSRRGR